MITHSPAKASTSEDHRRLQRLRGCMTSNLLLAAITLSTLRRPVLPGIEADLDIHIGGGNQDAQSGRIQLPARAQLHVPHAFAASQQQSGWILEQRATEEADVDMTFERVDVTERRITDTGDRATIVHQLADIVPALPHHQEPPSRERSQLERTVGQPGVDSRISSHRSGE